MKEKFVILFVCTGNTCRSPMAEGALRSLLEKTHSGRFEVISAGVAAATGFPATMYATEAARVWDVDISGHMSQPLTSALVDRADLILAMTPEHVQEILRIRRDAAGKTFLFKNFPDREPTGESVVDPIGQSLERYNATFLEIGEYLGKNLEEIKRRIDAEVVQD